MLRAAMLALLLLVACDPYEPEYVEAVTGGANLNDRTNTVQGEKQARGSMSVSSDGRFAVMHDATTTVVNLETHAHYERAEQWDRVVFGQGADGHAIAYVSKPGYDGLTAVDLETNTETWSQLPAYYNEEGAQFFRLSQDGATLLVGDVHRVFRISTLDGDVLGTSDVGDFPRFAQLSPSGRFLFVASETTWSDADVPSTPLTSVNVETGASVTIELPNCAAPMAILPSEVKLFLSPTFCEKGASYESDPSLQKPVIKADPVSVVDLDEHGVPRFVRNLPGFGPVTLSKSGERAVAYLDRGRVDASLFDDPKQLETMSPSRYQLMWIDPATNRFELQPIGEDLPRFAFSADGEQLLVDSTVVAQRTLTLFHYERSANGVRVDFLRDNPASSMLAVLDVHTRALRGIQGPRTSLDRFVQLPDARTVLTITKTSYDRGELSSIDLDSGVAREHGEVVHDLAALPDGRVVLRPVGKLPCVSSNLATCD